MCRETAVRVVEQAPVASTSASVLPEAELGVPQSASGSIPDISFIAWDKDVQDRMDANNLAWGVQYEIARGVSDGSWLWSNVTEEIIRDLRGSNAEAAPKVDKLLNRSKGRSVVGFNEKVWAELDREQDAILENSYRGLGLQGEWKGEKEWYGGQVQQVARIFEVEKGNYHLRLERMEMRKSHRFARYLGSRHFMQCKVPDKFEAGQNFLLKKFILCGRVFVPFCVKDGNVYLLETKENYQRRPSISQGDQYRVDFDELIAWHNPMHLNGKQSVNKWIARFDLGLSTSVPVLKFEAENIHFLEDEHAPHQGPEKVPTEKIYTDGCGFMNGAALMIIARQLAAIGHDRDARRPTAVQGRIFGSKGLWVLHPYDQSPDSPPRIWIRDSQVKVKLTPNRPWLVDELRNLHPAHFIFDLVAPSRASVGARLSRSTLMNLSHNKVPTEVLAELMKTSLKREIEPLMSWDGPNTDVLLHNAVDRSGRVSLSRIQRAAAGSARALGLVRRFDEKNQGEEDDESDGDGDPLDADETMHLSDKIICMLQAGFMPLESVYMYDEMRKAILRVVLKFVKEYRIVIPESADAFIVPDPCGVLNEGEIHFKSSRNLRDPLVYQCPDILTGDVLIYRNPCRLPSDIQKVKAVQHPALSEYVDVIVLPTKGAQSLASLLAGGDVDGDVAVCIYDQMLVQPFRTPPTSKEPPNFLETYFKPVSSIQTVDNLWKEMQRVDEGLSPGERQRILQRVLLKSTTANYEIGKYSKCHENAAYSLGYDHQDTIRLAFMFTTVLDSRKTGLEVNHELYLKDMKRFFKDLPECMADPKRPQLDNSNRLRRMVRGPFILDELLKEGKALVIEHEKNYDSRKPLKEKDDDLVKPWKSVAEYCKTLIEAKDDLGLRLAAELDTVKTHVETCCRHGWQGIAWGQSSPVKQSLSKQKKTKADNNKTLNTWAKKFALGPDVPVPILRSLGDLDLLMASYAFDYKPRFAFAVALRSLCMIKASAKGLSPMTLSIAQAISVPSSAVRIFSAQAAAFGLANVL
ncbi:RNA dependent RNA polymerase-domain-containing protein [Cristinia sonorae]|uniref:RNA-dependent RNA polymerase n=1 Tax=Cristinia sonorae TaxID=1940300 RepID=A0A8K0ULK0_9AGAR|nr:RNA dependent RNA polymerase-domain-containing protein [Cristinia sonorae]